MKTLKLFTPVLLFLLLTSNFSYSQSGWQKINGFYSYSYSYGQFASDNTIYLCGSYRGVAKSTDKGLTWVWKNNGVGSSVISGSTYLKFFNEDNGVIAGEYGGVYRTLDGGSNWSKIFDGTTFSTNVGAVSFVNENTGFVLTKHPSKILKTLDGGNNWTEVYTATNTNNIFFVSALTGLRNDYMGSNLPSGIQRTTDGGSTWDSVSSVPYDIKQFEKLNDNSILAMTYDGKLLKTTNNGNSWDILLSRSTSFGNLTVTGQNSFAVSWGDKAIVTYDGGINWIEKDKPAGIIFGNQSGDFVIASETIYRVTNNWNNFEDVFQNSIRENLNNIKIFDTNNFYIFADSGYFFKSSDGGVNISKSRLNITPTSMSFINLNTGFASYQNKVCKTTDAGMTWDTLYKNIPSQAGLYNVVSSVKFFSENFGVIYTLESAPSAFSNGIYRVTSNGGASWTNAAYTHSSGTSSGWSSSSITGFRMFANGTGYFSGHSSAGSFGHTTYDYHSFLKTTNFGAKWIELTSTVVDSAEVTNLFFTDENTGFAITSSGKFIKTINGSLSWSQVSETPNGSYIYMIDHMNGYVHNGYNNFYKTTNGGFSWDLQIVDMASSQLIGEISFLNSELGYIIGKGGQIFKTTTGGMVSVNNISQIADKYSLSQNYPNPFNPETKIQFSIPKNSLVKIVVYDLLGREVKQLVNEFKQQGSYNVSFNGANFSSGIYFYKLITDDFVETKKMILVK